MTRPGERAGSSNRRLKVRVKTGKGRTVSQKAWLERQLNDPYVAEARRQGYRSRAAFKLIEIDDKYRFLKPGQRVVDLGAAPGGWSQVAAARAKAGPDGTGRIVAIDMHGMEAIPGVTILHDDFLEDGVPAKIIAGLGGEKADAVISDMAGHATGHRQTDHIRIMALAGAAYEFAVEILKPGGTFLAKVLRGGTESEILLRMKQDFETVRHVKPKASRDDSAELFVLALRFRPRP